MSGEYDDDPDVFMRQLINCVPGFEFEPDEAYEQASAEEEVWHVRGRVYGELLDADLEIANPQELMAKLGPIIERHAGKSLVWLANQDQFVFVVAPAESTDAVSVYFSYERT